MATTQLQRDYLAELRQKTAKLTVQRPDGSRETYTIVKDPLGQ
jgi:hypothetical protein